MKTTKKRVLAVLTSLCLAVALLPVNAFAATSYGIEAIQNEIKSFNERVNDDGGFHGHLNTSVSGKIVTVTGTISDAQKGGILDLRGDRNTIIQWDATLTGNTNGTLIEVSGAPSGQSSGMPVFRVGRTGEIHNYGSGSAMMLQTGMIGVADLYVYGKLICDAGTAVSVINEGSMGTLQVYESGQIKGGKVGVNVDTNIVGYVNIQGTLEGGSTGLLYGGAYPVGISVSGTVRGGELAGIYIDRSLEGSVAVYSGGTIEGGVVTGASTAYEKDGGEGVAVTVESGGQILSTFGEAVYLRLGGSQLTVEAGGSVVSTAGAAAALGFDRIRPGQPVTLRAEKGSFLAGSPACKKEAGGSIARAEGVQVDLPLPLKDTYEKNSTEGLTVSPSSARAFWTNGSYSEYGYIKWSNTDGTSGVVLIPGVKVVEGSIPDPVYTVTFDPAGGRLPGGNTLTTGPDGKLRDSLPVPERTGYQFLGWFDEAGKQISKDTIFTANTTVTAHWKEFSKNDVSEKILFPQTSAEAVYTGEAMALSQFVGAASLDGQSGDAFTYTLRKDGGNAQNVTLDSTVTDAGTYTVTAKYEDEDNLGTQSRTFTIQKATPVLAVPQDTTTVIVGNQTKVAVTAKFPSSDALLPVTYENSNTKALSVEGAEGEAVLTGKAAGSATVTVSYAGGANINPVSASFQVEVIDLPRQEIAFTDGTDKSATYGDSPITDAAVNHSVGGGAITYTSSNEAVATVDGQGQVTITGAGETKITATAAAVPGAFAATSMDYTLTVAPKAVTAQASAITKTFDGTTAAKATATLDGLVNGDVLTQGVDYAVTARFDDPNAGTGKTVQVEVALKNTALAANYTLTNPAITLSDGVIEKAAARELPVQNVYVRYDDVAQHSQDVSRLLPGNAGARAYSLGSTEDAYGLLGNAFAVDADGQVTFSLRAGLTEDAVGQSASAPIILSSDNYADSTADVVVNVVYEFVPVLDVEDISAVYDGEPIADTAIRGTAMYDGQTVEGTWSFKAGQNLTAVADSGPKTVAFTPADTAVYAQVEATVLVTIDKADPTGAPSYTAIKESGHTLADAALDVGTITPGGTIAWDDGDATIVESNTAYGWTFTPADTDNYNLLTGTITPYKRSSGGSSGSSSYSVEVKSADNGSVSVSPSRASRGNLVTVTVKPDEGYVLETLTITDRDGDKIDYKSKGDGKYTFTMPASSVTIKATFTEEELAFTDVPADAYYAEAVKWAVAEGITSGTTATTFAPNSGCTRGQVVTFLWRAAGEPEPSSTGNPFTDVSVDAYNYKAILWAYENGITGGTTATTFAPNATCTRAQIVTFLYRANGQAVDSGSAFTDVPADAYYADAVNWAVAEGITGGTTATTFAPNATCTRAQVVTFLYRDMAQ